MTERAKEIGAYAAVGLGLWGGLTVTQEMFEHADDLVNKYIKCVSDVTCFAYAQVYLVPYEIMVISIPLTIALFGFLIYRAVQYIFKDIANRALIIIAVTFASISTYHGVKRLQQWQVMTHIEPAFLANTEKQSDE